MSVYNYQTFPLDKDIEDFHRFPSLLRVGNEAPDGEIFDATEGRSHPLSDHWAAGPLVIEFGSFT